MGALGLNALTDKGHGFVQAPLSTQGWLNRQQAACPGLGVRVEPH